MREQTHRFGMLSRQFIRSKIANGNPELKAHYDYYLRKDLAGGARGDGDGSGADKDQKKYLFKHY